MSKENIDYALTLSLNRFSKSLKLAAGKVDDMGRTIEKNLRPVRKSFGSLGTAMAVGIAAGVASATLALQKLKNELQESVNLSIEQTNSEIRLAGVLRSTGEAAGFTLDQLRGMASELQNLTGIGDEVILSGAGILATFKQIKGDQFKDAIKAAMDMSAVMEQDLKSSIIQVGKALNDPKTGLGSLSRAGVTFSDQQKELIKSLTETGRIAEAQKVILAELERQFGGVATALGDSYGGAIKKAKAAFGDLKEEIGFTIERNQFFIEIVDMMTESFKGWGKWINKNSDYLRGLAKDGFLTLVDGIVLTIDIVRHLYNAWKGFGILFRGIIISMVNDAKMIFSAFRKVLSPIDMLLDAMAKLGLIDSNPLKDFEETLNGFADHSVDEFNRFVDEVSDTNAAFDNAKESVESFRAKISKIQPEYKNTADEITNDNKKVEQSIELINGVWTNVFRTARQESDRTTQHIIDNNRKAAQSLQTSTTSERYATGGRIGGYGGGDIIPALLEPGEWVVRKEAVARYGNAFMSKLNSMRFPRFATGGPVAATAGGEAVYNLTVNYSGGGSSADARAMAKQVIGELQRMHRRVS